MTTNTCINSKPQLHSRKKLLAHVLDVCISIHGLFAIIVVVMVGFILPSQLLFKA